MKQVRNWTTEDRNTIMHYLCHTKNMEEYMRQLNTITTENGLPLAAYLSSPFSRLLSLSGALSAILSKSSKIDNTHIELYVYIRQCIQNQNLWLCMFGILFIAAYANCD